MATATAKDGLPRNHVLKYRISSATPLATVAAAATNPNTALASTVGGSKMNLPDPSTSNTWNLREFGMGWVS